MIKVKVNNEYKDVVKIFCGGTLQKEITKVWSREAQDYVYESSVEYTGAIPIAITANGDALLDYRIYGADGGVGERTENLFNINELYSTVVVQGQTFTKPPSAYFFDVFSGTSGGSAPMDLQKSIPVTSGTYTLSFEESETKIAVVFSDGETQTVISCSSSVTSRAFDVLSDGYISIRCEDLAVCSVKKLQIVKAATAPTAYIPYGYKLPMTVSDGDTEQTAPVYIGENQLDAREYVSYGEQKIYKLVGEGVDPVNLFDEDSEDIMTGYEIIGGGVRANSLWLISERIPVVSGYKYIKEIFGNAILQYVSYNDENPTRTSFSGNAYIVPNNVRYIRINCLIDNKTTAKFYRNLSPTDPPVPLPEIPTIDGTTIIDYEGDPKPSQMYVKYRR